MEQRKRGRRPKIELKEKVRKLAQSGLTYQQIANALDLKSHQLAQYHFKSYPQ